MSQRLSHSLRRWGALVVLLGCSTNDEAVSAPLAANDIRTMLTDEVASGLTPTALFPTPQGSASWVTPEQAQSMAVAYIKLFGPKVSGWISSIRGKPVDFSVLTPSAQVYLAESPYEELSDSVFRPLRSNVGAFWLVRLLEAGDPALVVAVSVHSTDLLISDKGISSRNGGRGNDFRVWPVALNGTGYPAFLPPEAAVARAFEKLAVRIASTPRFIRRGVNFLPQEGAWRLELETATEVSSGIGARFATGTVYVDLTGQLSAPAVGTAASEAAPRISTMGMGVLQLIPRSDLAVARVPILPIRQSEKEDEK